MAKFPSSNNGPEKHEGRSRESAPEKRDSGKESREIQKESDKFIEGVSEVVEGVESGVESVGEVAEGITEGKKRAPANGIRGTAKGVKRDQKKEVEIPKIDVMRVQIYTRIKKEIAVLEKEAKRIMNNPTKFSPFHFVKVVARIRALREILAGLAHATAEALKTWWLKYVKDIHS